MKNLKRALSFAMAAVMLVGMMAIGTSAFTDDADIVNDTAVNIMNQLGIINGKPDGSFDPEATVTRGEMAKMICTALNGGKAPVLDTAVSTYPDTVGHWAAGYIEYCSSLGIVAGSTDGNFYPNNPITGTEAAKMVLIALGYVAENEGFVNNKDWSTNINVVANKKGLYEDVTSLPGAPISRDNAAQMLYNGMKAKTVYYDYKLGTVNGDLVSIPVAYDYNGASSILETKFSVTYPAAAVLTKVAYDADKDEYTVTVDGVNYKVANDYSDMLQMKVQVLKKEAGKAYGLYAVDSVVMYTGVYGDVDFTADEYKTVTKTYGFNTTTEVTAEPWWNCTVIDVDGDEDADTVVVNPVTFTTVDFASDTSFTLNVGGNKVYKDADKATPKWVAKDKFAKGDYVSVVAAANTLDNKTVYSKLAETENVKIEAVKTGEVRIDGTWYSVDDGVTASYVELGDKADVVIVNGYVVAATEVEAAAKDVLLVTALGAANEFDSAKKNVKVMYADGTTAVIVVDVTGGAPSQDHLYTWAVEDGVYTLTEATAAAIGLDTKSENNDYNATTGKVGDYRVADDAVIFAKKGDKYSVITGADLKKMNGLNDDATNITVFGETVNGFATAKVALLITDAFGTTGDEVYGYVVGASYQAKEGDDVYTYFDVWNGKEVVSVKEKATFNLAKGDIISYTDEGDGVVDVLGNAALIADAVAGQKVTAYDGEVIVIDGVGEFNMKDDETVVLYVDSKDDKGAEGGAIALANDTDGNGTLDVANVMAKTSGGKLVLLVVDVNNEWYAEPVEE